MAESDPNLVEALEDTLRHLRDAREIAADPAGMRVKLRVCRMERDLERLLDAAKRGDRRELKRGLVTKKLSLMFSKFGKRGGAGKHKEPGKASALNALQGGRPPGQRSQQKDDPEIQRLKERAIKQTAAWHAKQTAARQPGAQ